MKKYRVNVNGTVYEVELEEITAPAASAAPAPGWRRSRYAAKARRARARPSGSWCAASVCGSCRIPPDAIRCARR